MKAFRGDRLKELRKKKKVSQQRLANILKVRRASVSDWEHCVVEPSWFNVVSLAQYFEVSLDEFIAHS